MFEQTEHVAHWCERQLPCRHEKLLLHTHTHTMHTYHGKENGRRLGQRKIANVTCILWKFTAILWIFLAHLFEQIYHLRRRKFFDTFRSIECTQSQYWKMGNFLPCLFVCAKSIFNISIMLLNLQVIRLMMLLGKKKHINFMGVKLIRGKFTLKRGKIWKM